VKRAYYSPSELQHNGATTGYLMGILVQKSCPNTVRYLVVDPGLTKTTLLLDNKAMDAYGQCIVHKVHCLACQPQIMMSI